MVRRVTDASVAGTQCSAKKHGSEHRETKPNHRSETSVQTPLTHKSPQKPSASSPSAAYSEDWDFLRSVGDSQFLTGIYNTPGVPQYTGHATDQYGDQIRRSLTKVPLAAYDPTGIILSPTTWEHVEVRGGQERRVPRRHRCRNRCGDEDVASQRRRDNRNGPHRLPQYRRSASARSSTTARTCPSPSRRRTRTTTRRPNRVPRGRAPGARGPAARVLRHRYLVPHQATFALLTRARRRRSSAWRFRQMM